MKLFRKDVVNLDEIQIEIQEPTYLDEITVIMNEPIYIWRELEKLEIKGFYSRISEHYETIYRRII